MNQVLYVTQIFTLLVIVSVFLFIFAGFAGAWDDFPELEVDPDVIETIVYEASGESIVGQIAVASVIKTRMKQRRKTAIEVVIEPHQFSCWHDGKPTQSRRIRGSEAKTALEAWNAAKPGKYNHYARYDCKPYWAKDAKSSQRIGNHIFYQL